MKIAILIPGLVRFYKKTYKSLLNNIDKDKNNKYDIYLSFWDKTKQRDGEEIIDVDIDHVVSSYGDTKSWYIL